MLSNFCMNTICTGIFGCIKYCLASSSISCFIGMECLGISIAYLSKSHNSLLDNFFFNGLLFLSDTVLTLYLPEFSILLNHLSAFNDS